jgi:pimeloyl-ACP methyl ester carboxylesterase
MASSPSPSQSTSSQTFVLPNGRTLGYATYGSPPSPTTPTILYFHGFPTSRLEGAFLVTTKIPIHIISIDRPGIGLSSFQPSRRVLDWPADVLTLVDHLDIAQFHVVGGSGGAPYALACAKEITRTRLLSTAVVSGIYPLALGTQGMLFGIKALLYAGLWLPQSVMTKVFDWQFGNTARGEDRKGFEELFMKAMDQRPEKDRRCLDDLRFREIMIESMREAFRQGSAGAAWDIRLFGQWGFGLEEVDGNNVTLWHGKEDVNAPFSMAEKAVKLMKGSALKVFEEETHLSLPYNHVEEMIRGLLKL